MWFVELIRSLAWPLTAVFGIWWLAPNVFSILSELLKKDIEIPGILKTTGRADIAEQKLAKEPTRGELPNISPPTLSPAVKVIRENVVVHLNDIPDEQKEERLITAVAIANLQFGHEYVYNRIFGSQIVGLKRLNERGSVSVEEAQAFFEPYAAQFPNIYDTYPFESWLGFLKQMLLVQQNDNKLEITEIGRDFLAYLITQRLGEIKPW